MPKKVLFVCLGNICRSTMAEAVLRHMVSQAGKSKEILVDSAGTSRYHIGELPHRGTRKKLEEEGISWQGISGRQVTKKDLEGFDYIVGMDDSNTQDLLKMATKEQREKVFLLSDFIEGAAWGSVPDPWYSGNFDETFRLVSQGCQALLDRLLGEIR